MKGVTLAWLAFLAASTWRYERDPAASSPNTALVWLPPPNLYVGSAVVFSLLGFLASPAPELAATFGWALVVAALINTDNPLLAPGSGKRLAATLKAGTPPPARPRTAAQGG